METLYGIVLRSCIINERLRFSVYCINFLTLNLRISKEYLNRYTKVTVGGIVLYRVPIKFRDKLLCKEAVKHCGCALQHVPIDLRDRDMCIIAIIQDGCALYYVPIELRDYYMYHGCQTKQRGVGIRSNEIHPYRVVTRHPKSTNIS